VYVKVGMVAIALLVVVLAGFQHLLRELLVSQHRASQLASLQLGMMSALLHTLDARDRMTARHSAAVARYSREIARAAGLSEHEQELVHTAGLLHDLGKFTFPDRILKAGTRLGPGEWRLVRRHPYQGAKIVSQVEGYGPVADIVLAHHERIDGAGYPRGLNGDEIPELARILSVADVYDVMTARDSYRKPVSPLEAIEELQLVAGTQLDPRFVDIFVRLLDARDMAFRHGVDADFDAELALERRVHAYAAGGR
jgi:putative nucleotidyltransferase with HDIG domain